MEQETFNRTSTNLNRPVNRNRKPIKTVTNPFPKIPARPPSHYSIATTVIIRWKKKYQKSLLIIFLLDLGTRSKPQNF